MSDRYTDVCLPSLRYSASLAEHGRREPADMIAMLKALAKRQKEEAEAILAAPSTAFRVETYVGLHVQKQREVLQQGEEA